MTDADSKNRMLGIAEDYGDRLGGKKPSRE